jgi:hypothetical protein
LFTYFVFFPLPFSVFSVFLFLPSRVPTALESSFGKGGGIVYFFCHTFEKAKEKKKGDQHARDIEEKIKEIKNKNDDNEKTKSNFFMVLEKKRKGKNENDDDDDETKKMIQRARAQIYIL